MKLDLLNVVHALSSSVGLGVLGEADEAETTATTSVTVLDNSLNFGQFCEENVA